MKYLFFDTETTSANPNTTTCLQLAGTLVDDYSRRCCSFNSILKQDHIDEVPQGAQNVHGISAQFMNSTGISPDVAFSYFLEYCRISDMIIGHNVIFDIGVIKNLAKHLNRSEELSSGMEGKQIVCTMKLAKDIVKAPLTEKMKAAGFTGFKNPTLSESYQHFFHKKLSGAHDAMIDVDACLKIFFKIKKLLS